MTKDEINRLVKCQREADPDDDMTFQFDKVKHATTKAVLIVADGDEHWIPYKHLVDWYPDTNECTISGWIAGEKGLL